MVSPSWRKTCRGICAWSGAWGQPRLAEGLQSQVRTREGMPADGALAQGLSHGHHLLERPLAGRLVGCPQPSHSSRASSCALSPSLSLLSLSPLPPLPPHLPLPRSLSPLFTHTCAYTQRHMQTHVHAYMLSGMRLPTPYAGGSAWRRRAFPHHPGAPPRSSYHPWRLCRWWAPFLPHPPPANQCQPMTW